MAYYYSASQRAFYCTEIVSVDVMPADKVAVADEAYKSLMAAQNAGKLIRPGAGGAPEAVDQAGGAATGITHELTAATADTLGHVKIGAGVNVTQDGTISVDTEVLFRQDSWSTRIASTVYAVGDVVDCPHKRNLELVCTQAGTTDSGDLAEGGLTHGATVTDGSVKWKVRAKIKTINDQETDASGAVKIDVGVKTVNNTPPDQSGNVNVDISTKRDHTIQIANADLNTLLEDKTWACSGTLRNTPITCTFCIVHAYDTGAPVSGNIVQVCYVPNQADNTVRAFWRNCDNGVTFGKWSESGAVKTVNSVAPDTSGNVEIPAATPETYGLVRAATDATVIDEDADDAAITPAVYHDVSDFRHKNTAYALGDKVECMFNFELFLECTKAGTTSSTPLNTRTVKHGQVITDGTAEWTVRTHIRSINNAVADASGNITPEQTGCLPLTGGKMRGNIVLPVGAIYTRNDDIVETQIVSDTDGKFGSGLFLRSANDPSDLRCGFILATRPNIDSSNLGASLVGYADGRLTWDNQHVARLVDTWRNGDSWYRAWSDGWIEQGGISAGIPGVGGLTVYLHRALTTNQYTVLAGPTNGLATLHTGGIGVTWREPNCFGVDWVNPESLDGTYWYVCGY